MKEIYAKPVEFLKGISFKRKSALLKLGVKSCGDLLHFFPRTYENWTHSTAIGEFEADKDYVFRATVSKSPVLYRRGKFSTLHTVLSDSTGSVRAVWFNQPYMEKKLSNGSAYIFSGRCKAGKYGLEFANPSIEKRCENIKIAGAADAESEGKKETYSLKAVYPLTQGLNQSIIRSLEEQLLSLIDGRFSETLPEWIRRKRGLATAAFSYEEIHFPKNSENLGTARKRLAFEELFLLQLGLKLLKLEREDRSRADKMKLTPEMLNVYRKTVKELPFDLTLGQKRILNEIAADLSRELPMNRLVQGDVGSGKTVIASLAMLQAFLSGYQSAFLCPTSVLAAQHYATISSQLKGSGAEIALLTGELSSAKKQAVKKKILSGQVQIVIGTHALFQKNVNFNKLGLLVTDEQHRFGVEQRGMLAGGPSGALRPHVLVMSATPIPRSLGLVIYGDLDVSQLRELPKGRKSIKTVIRRFADEPAVRGEIERRIQAGEQVYIICPLVKDSENSPGLKSVEESYEEYVSAFPNVNVGLLHGRLKEKEKNALMEDFYSGNIKLLVSTTVVEVGVDNPSACMIVIKNAEMYGLAQLHQLRGRVGRGERSSLCVLQSDVSDGTARERLEVLCQTQNGFEIAEADLKLRGPGDFFGTRQHGIPELRIANLYEDSALIMESREDAAAYLRRNPGFDGESGEALKFALDFYFGGIPDNPSI